MTTQLAVSKPNIHLLVPKVFKPFMYPKRFKVAYGGRGCVHPDTLIDTPNGKIAIKDFKGGEIYSYSHHGRVIANACQPICYPKTELFTVSFVDGSSMVVTAQHRFLTSRGWVEACKLSSYCSVLQLSESPHGQPLKHYDACQLGLPADALHLMQRVLGWIYRYCADSHLCDELLQSEVSTYRDVVQALAYGREHVENALLHGGGLEPSQLHNHTYHNERRPSILPVAHSLAGKSFEEMENYTFDKFSELSSVLYLASQLFLEKNTHVEQAQELAKLVLSFDNPISQHKNHEIVANMLARVIDDSSYSESLVSMNENSHDHYTERLAVDKVIYHSHDNYYDMFVPFYNNYVTNGIINHNSAKSWSVARILIMMAYRYKLRILCAREIQASMADSVLKLLSDQIEDLGLSDSFHITQNSIISHTGSEFLFKGLHHNMKDIKSTEKVDICWVEEAQAVSLVSWKTLIPTIRAKGSEIWITFNPENESDPTYQRFVANHDPESVVVKVNYTENPRFPEVLRTEMERDKRLNYDDYLHVWLGMPKTISDSIIFKNKFVVEDFETPKDVDEFYFGADWGFAKDPTVLTRSFIRDGCLFIDYEAYGVGVEINETPQLFDSITKSRDYTIMGDSSRPETISALNHLDFHILPAKKWAGSVQDGITHLRNFERIVIHPRCPETAKEFGLYAFKIDKITGKVLPVIIDANNHCIDSIRYALDGHIINSETGLHEFYKRENAERIAARERLDAEANASISVAAVEVQSAEDFMAAISPN